VLGGLFFRVCGISSNFCGGTLHNPFTAEPGQDFLQAGRLIALFVHDSEQAPKRFYLVIPFIWFIWHESWMSEAVKRLMIKYAYLFAPFIRFCLPGDTAISRL
jgi:hypothetical protein